MEVSDFEILLIIVMFYLYNVEKLIYIELIGN